jgi:alpha-L-rhamnosidase
MKLKRTLALCTGLVLAASSPMAVLAQEEASVAEEKAIVNLKTQGMVNPLGLDEATPSFSWQMQSSAVGAAQKSYQIVVSDAEGNQMWDSGVVESPVSHEIVYEGEALQPCTAYTWQVTVTDEEGNTLVSDSAVFETAFMDTTKESWDGAEWIGAPDLQLDAASYCVFQISTGITIPEGSTSGSVIFGADDFRLKNEVFNTQSMAGENYVRVELDISDVEGSGAVINLYRMGYTPQDSQDTPFMVIADGEDLSEIITSENKNQMHQLGISCSGSLIQVSVDGERVGDDASVNPLGDSSSYNSFPNLNSIGFAAKPGQNAVFTDYQVQNAGRFGQGILFGEETGATYRIFEGMDGVTAEGNTITVNGGANGILGYADPTYSAAPMLRTEFEAKEGVSSARLYVSAQGIYDFYMNGQEVAPEEWFNPGAAEYDAYMPYTAYDVTEFVQEGQNAMGAVLGEGWWTGQMTFEASNYNYFGDQPALMAKLVVNYEDGSSDVVVSDDETWDYYKDGPVRLASFFQGERYDATKEAAVDGWTNAGFDASQWEDASVVETRKQFVNAKMVTRTDEPVHVIRTNEVAEALGATKEGADSYIYDMGENVSGVPTITIPEEYAKPGETITLRFAEILYPETEEYTNQGIDGTLMVENYRAAMVTDFYTMKEGENVFTPSLTFHGYRYIEISGLGAELPAENVRMQVLSSLDAAGTYESSNELTNQLYQNIVNSTTSNYISIPTDCPQRNERMGWAGDAQVFALTGSYIADTYNFLEFWMDSVRADSGENGMSHQFTPAYIQYEPEDEAIEHKGTSFGITWNCLAITIPYNLYMQTGRKDILEENLENIYAYMDTLVSTPLKYKTANDEKLEEPRLTGEVGMLADHLSRVVTDSTLLGNAVYINCLNQASEIAEIMGDTERAESYRETMEKAKEAWNELFLDPETKKTRNTKGEIQDTQASYATPLRFGVISEENMEQVLENYEASIAEASGTDTEGNEILPYTMTTGFNATGNLLSALSDNGMNDTAYKLFEATDYASWLYPVTQGATSIWERWNSYTSDKGFGGNNSMNSFNHYSFGAVGEWMMAYQLGIQADKAQPGYLHFILQPTVGGTFTDAKGTYESSYGTIASGWTAENGVMTSYDVTVPANTSATLYLPTAGEVSACEGVTLSGETEHNSNAVQQFELAAGTYHFEIAEDAVVVSAV